MSNGIGRRLCRRRRPFISQAGRRSGTVFKDDGQASRAADLQGSRLQLDSAAAVPYANATAQQSGIHHRAGERGEKTGVQVPSGLSLFRHVGRSGKTVHTPGLEGQIARRTGPGGRGLYENHDRRVSRGRRDARHGAAGQRNHNGMLWPDGKLPEHWDNFADLLKAGIGGVDAGCGDANAPGS